MSNENNLEAARLLMKASRLLRAEAEQLLYGDPYHEISLEVIQEAKTCLTNAQIKVEYENN